MRLRNTKLKMSNIHLNPLNDLINFKQPYSTYTDAAAWWVTSPASPHPTPRTFPANGSAPYKLNIAPSLHLKATTKVAEPVNYNLVTT